MAYNTRRLKTDLDTKPIPQYYNPVTDDYEVLQGEAGGNRVVLYGPDGKPLAPVTQVALQAELAAVTNEIAAMKTELALIKTNQLSGDQKVQLTGKFVAEEQIKTDLSIGAGATVYLYGGMGRIADCPKVAIALKTTDNSTPKVSAKPFPVVAGGVSPSGTQMAIDNVLMNAYRACSLPLALATPKVDFTITNHDTAAHTFDVYLYRMADTRW